MKMNQEKPVPYRDLYIPLYGNKYGVDFDELLYSLYELLYVDAASIYGGWWSGQTTGLSPFKVMRFIFNRKGYKKGLVDVASADTDIHLCFLCNLHCSFQFFASDSFVSYFLAHKF